MKKRLQEEFQIHKTLNNKIWDENNRLRQDVKDKLLQIVELFKSQLQIPLNIVDLQLCGSNASYNYTEYSDLDLHIIANYETVDYDEEILQTVYNMEKTKFNRDYDISLRGVEVELYVQDVRSSVTSNGIYSIMDDRWVKFPKPIENIINYDTSAEVDRWLININDAISNNDKNKAENLLNNIYLMRHNAIARDGEYSKGNQIFKEVRNLGKLDELKQSIKNMTAKQLSLENLSLGHLVNRLK